MPDPQFNAPPGWPVPHGWKPSPGWTPAPTWPPAPEDWQFWRTSEAPKKHDDHSGGRGPKLAIAAAALVVVAIAIVGSVLVLGRHNSTAPTTYEVVGAVAVGTNPVALAVRAQANRLYVVNSQDASLSVLDIKARTVIRTAPVGQTPNDIDVSQNSGTVYVANWKDSTISVLDAGGNLIDTVGVGEAPYAVAVDDSSNRVFVSNSGSNSVSVIDMKDNTVLATIPVGGTPNDVALDDSGRRLFVANCGGTVSVINLETLSVDASLLTEDGACSLAVDGGTHHLFLANYETGELTTYNTDSRIVVRSAPYGEQSGDGRYGVASLAVDPDSKALLVLADMELSVIDSVTGELRSSVELGDGSANGVAQDNQHKTIYVANGNLNSVVVLQGS
ncbi:YncE family protein [Mycobacterium sp. DSM 3803]|nr:YncE family protein [Mycobacterium sp. DSM 3803]